MPKNTGLGGILRGVNDVTRTVGTVTRTTQSVKKSVGGNKQNTKQNTRQNTNKNAKQEAKQEAKQRGKLNAKQAEPEVQAKDDTWLCECGLTCTTKFCGGCGKPAPAPLICPKCQWERPMENNAQKFCGNCGNRLEE